MNTSLSLLTLVFYGFESAIPQIDRFMFADMSNLPLLNDIANDYTKMSDNDRIKFKAILSAEKIDNIMDVSLVADIMDKYELSTTPFEENTFYKDYLLHSLPTAFDERWLDNINTEKPSQKLVEMLGAKITEYGVLSAFNEPLYKLVPFDKQQNEVAVHEEAEKFEFVEIAGQQALFTNSRLNDDEVQMVFTDTICVMTVVVISAALKTKSLLIMQVLFLQRNRYSSAIQVICLLMAITESTF